MDIAHRSRCLVICSLLLAAATLSLGIAGAVRAESEDTKSAAKTSKHLGKQIPPFSALRIDDTTFHSAAHKEQVLVVTFMGVQCPLANLYYPRLKELQQKFRGKSVAFLTVNSNEQDSLIDVRKQARDTHKIKFPVLKDAGNAVADLFGANRTPEVFVLDAERRVRYHGMIDDQYGYLYRRQIPTKHYVKDAIKALLSDQKIATASTPLEGCHIGRKRNARKKTNLSYYRDVVPILQNRCQECHRQGEIGPFALNDYEDVSSWAETIKETVIEKRMPPWGASPAHGSFANDMSMTDEEIATLVKWVDHGCPEGNSADSPPEKRWPKGWNIGQPDQIFEMPRPLPVAATGVVPYLYSVVSEVFEEDRWVQALEIRPGKREVVHHILALILIPGDRRRSQNGLERGYLGACVPGNTYVRYPPGHAKRIPAGTRIVFQLHYTPNGTATSDRSQMGIIFAKQPPKYEVKTHGLAQTHLNIKAGEANHRVEKTLRIDQDLALTGMMPHMHLRGKSFQFDVTHRDGRKETLLQLPRWDFNWQHQYLLKKPLQLKKGSQIKITGHWDNSTANPNNVFPLVDVRWGDQTWDEMFIGYLDYVVPREN